MSITFSEIFLFFMQYFKNADLTKMYPISEKAVRNWIAAAKEGKLELTLYEDGGKTYIANTSQNAAIIDKLVVERKKYVNARSRKTVQPAEKFFELFNKDQILDIITHLEAYNEIPLKYSYFDEGASYWDRYSRKLATEEVPNIMNRTIELLDINTEYLLHFLKDFSRVNVIDIGPGNGQPVRQFLSKLIDEKKLSRYIAIDISQAMLDKVEENTAEWFGKEFPYEGYVKDVTQERFKDVLGEDAVGVEGDNVCNLVLVFGLTLANFRSPTDSLRLIYNSMGPNDLLIYSLMLDSDANKRYFDFSVQPATSSKTKNVSLRSLLLVNYLNIDQSMYDVEQFYDEERNRRVVQIRLRIALTIEFHLGDFLRRVSFNKGDIIELWSNKHQTAEEMLEQLRECDFKLLQTSQSKDHEYILTISEVKETNN